MRCVCVGTLQNFSVGPPPWEQVDFIPLPQKLAQTPQREFSTVWLVQLTHTTSFVKARGCHTSFLSKMFSVNFLSIFPALLQSLSFTFHLSPNSFLFPSSHCLFVNAFIFLHTLGCLSLYITKFAQAMHFFVLYKVKLNPFVRLSFKSLKWKKSAEHSLMFNLLNFFKNKHLLLMIGWIRKVMCTLTESIKQSN